MKKTKAFTLVEILVVISIMWLMTWAVSLWIESFWTSTELINTENLIKLKIRSEKFWILSGEVGCSQIDLLSWRDYFTILNSKQDWDFCKKDFFWDVFVKDWKVFIQNISSSNAIEALELWEKFSDLDYSNVIENSRPYISFKIRSWRSYRIISSNENEKEEFEINFYNMQRDTLDISDPKIVILDDVSWVNFRNRKIRDSVLKIVFQAPKPESRMYLKNDRVNDVKIIMVNQTGDSKEFDLFSAFLYKFTKYYSFDLEN